MKIAVLVSGGVDSSVALHMMKAQGHDVVAFYLKIWLEDELSFLGTCPWEEDLAYVRAVCEQVGVPLEVISLQKEYHEEVVTYTIAEVKAGRTPNPDVLCNQRIKFGAFYTKIDESFDKVVTGHYAQLSEENGLFYLQIAPDAIKDQTYFLSHLSQKQLARAWFPIGTMTKPEVRAYAQKYNLPTKNRKDSQGICFLGKLKFSEFIKFHVGSKKGDLIEIETGKKMGEHEGFWYFTIGQRQGIGLSGGPWYVVKKDVASNTVFISRAYYTEDKIRDRFIIENCSWITSAPADARIQVQGEQPLMVKLRHGAAIVPCVLTPIQNNMYRVQLKTRDQGIAPGQFAVFYDAGVCVGGGVISEEQ